MQSIKVIQYNRLDVFGSIPITALSFSTAQYDSKHILLQCLSSQGIVKACAFVTHVGCSQCLLCKQHQLMCKCAADMLPLSCLPKAEMSLNLGSEYTPDRQYCRAHTSRTKAFVTGHNSQQQVATKACHAMGNQPVGLNTKLHSTPGMLFTAMVPRPANTHGAA